MTTRAPLTLFEKRALFILAILIGSTRFLAVAHSMWDWDEGLFSLGVQNYDVAEHRPHPPGYPLYIAAAKVVALAGLDDFRCLQVIVVLGALFVFPVVFWLAREIGFDFPTSIAGAAIYAFLPNIWIYGGTGFSDVPATVIALAACALLLRGRADARAYVFGAIVLGISAGFRPANLLVGAAPALLATWVQLRKFRNYRAVAAAMLLGAAIVAGSYVGAALASRSIEAFVDVVQLQSRYVRDIDSWRSPIRPPLSEAAIAFLLWPFWQQDVLNALVIGSLMSIVAAIVKRRTAPFLALAIFVPTAITSWLNLDINTASRYAIGYMALHALLAADGFSLFRRKAQIALCAATCIVFIVWTWPALQMQRSSDSPPVAALKWIRDNTPPSTPVYVHAGYRPQADYLLGERQHFFFDGLEEIPLSMGDAWMVDWRIHEGAQTFLRPHKTLWKIVRRRGFEASITRAAVTTRFGDGWHPQEGTALAPFRWMKKEGVLLLPAIRGEGIASIRATVPVEVLPASAVLEVYWNGQLIERVNVTEEKLERSWKLQSRADVGNELRLAMNTTVIPSALGNSTDDRELGLKLDRLSWLPSQ